jgi:hypothetical protein
VDLARRRREGLHNRLDGQAGSLLLHYTATNARGEKTNHQEHVELLRPIVEQLWDEVEGGATLERVASSSRRRHGSASPSRWPWLPRRWRAQ